MDANRKEQHNNNKEEDDKSNNNMKIVPGGIHSYIPPVVARRHHPKNRKLPPNFEPGPYDVICGRGKVCYNHIGNRRFRLTIEMNTERYLQAPSKLDRSLIVIEVVDLVRAATPNGGFVKRDHKHGGWIEIGDVLAREKVGHAIRDAINARNAEQNQDGQQPKIFRELFDSTSESTTTTVADNNDAPLVVSNMKQPSATYNNKKKKRSDTFRQQQQQQQVSSATISSPGSSFFSLSAQQQQKPPFFSSISLLEAMSLSKEENVTKQTAAGDEEQYYPWSYLQNIEPTPIRVPSSQERPAEQRRHRAEATSQSPGKRRASRKDG